MFYIKPPCPLVIETSKLLWSLFWSVGLIGAFDLLLWFVWPHRSSPPSFSAQGRPLQAWSVSCDCRFFGGVGVGYLCCNYFLSIKNKILSCQISSLEGEMSSVVRQHNGSLSSKKIPPILKKLEKTKVREVEDGEAKQGRSREKGEVKRCQRIEAEGSEAWMDRSEETGAEGGL